ncbi:hypothetical protein PUN4_1830002 [Paraburkholderia unamae]|nr:hypothetical protein PUN4_1830002 [Paraburkholderia unamae]
MATSRPWNRPRQPSRPRSRQLPPGRHTNLRPNSLVAAEAARVDEDRARAAALEAARADAVQDRGLAQVPAAAPVDAVLAPAQGPADADRASAPVAARHETARRRR